MNNLFSCISLIQAQKTFSFHKCTQFCQKFFIFKHFKHNKKTIDLWKRRNYYTVLRSILKTEVLNIKNKYHPSYHNNLPKKLTRFVWNPYAYLVDISWNTSADFRHSLLNECTVLPIVIFLSCWKYIYKIT